jgi:hypothetical protein
VRGSCLVASAVVTLASSAWAQDAAALFDSGLRKMEAHDYASGCPALRESYRLDPRPGTLFTLAECEAKWGKGVWALRHYRAFLDTVAQMSPSELPRQEARARIAETQASALDRDVPQVTFAFAEPAPPGTKITIDGEPVEPSVAFRADVGAHAIVVASPGKGQNTESVTLATGDRRRIELDVPGAPPKPSPPPKPPAAPAPEPPAPSPPPSSGPNLLPWIAGGVGVAGLVVGSITGGVVLAKKSVANDHCQGTACDAEGQRAVDTGRTLGWVSTIAFGLGVVGIGTAIVLFATGGGSNASSSGARVLVTGAPSAPSIALDAVF